MGLFDFCYLGQPYILEQMFLFIVCYTVSLSFM